MIKNPLTDLDETNRIFNEAIKDFYFVEWLKRYRSDHATMIRSDVVGFYSAYMEGIKNGNTT